MTDSDSATAQTVRKMCEYIHAGAADPVVQSWARSAVAQLAPSRSSLACCWAVWWFVKHHVRFVDDDDTIRRLFGETNQLELLIAPAVLVRMKDPGEDCDGFTMLICSMLECLGIESQIVTIACAPDDPRRFSHVFPRANCDGKWITLDASHGEYPGWQVPREHTTRLQAWALNGSPINGGDSMSGLHGYVPSPRLRVLNGRRRRGMGDGDTFDFSSWLGSFGSDPATPGASISDTPGFFGALTSPSGDSYGSSAPGAGVNGSILPSAISTSSSSDTMAWISKLFGQASPLIAQAIQKPGQYLVQNPNGQLVISNTGAAPSSALNASLGGGSSTMLFLLIGVGAVIFFASQHGSK